MSGSVISRLHHLCSAFQIWATRCFTEKRGALMFDNWPRTFTLCVVTIGELVKCKHGVDHPVSGDLKHWTEHWSLPCFCPPTASITLPGGDINLFSFFKCLPSATGRCGSGRTAGHPLIKRSQLILAPAPSWRVLEQRIKIQHCFWWMYGTASVCRADTLNGSQMF